MRVLTVREQYVVLNHSPVDMLLRAYALPLSKEKVWCNDLNLYVKVTHGNFSIVKFVF